MRSQKLVHAEEDLQYMVKLVEQVCIFYGMVHQCNHFMILLITLKLQRQNCLSSMKGNYMVPNGTFMVVDAAYNF